MTNPTTPTSRPLTLSLALARPGFGTLTRPFASRETMILDQWVARQAARYEALLATIAAAPRPRAPGP